MKFLPIENIVFKSKLNEDEIIERLTDEVEFENTYINYVSAKLFDGEITDNKFEITRKIYNSNSYNIKAIGTIEEDTDGTKINVKIKFRKGVTIFLCFGFGFAFLISIMFLTNGVWKLQPLGMLLFFYLFIMLSFKYESYKSKKLLKNIFKAEIISE